MSSDPVADLMRLARDYAITIINRQVSMQGHMRAAAVLEDAIRAALAEERRKALEEALTNCRGQRTCRIELRALIDKKE